jgi:formylglycine-generating enzyme required for sulfatase activity
MKRLFCIAVVASGAALASDLAGSVVPDRTQNDKPKHFTNSLGMKFVWLPPGTFLMGSRKDEEGRDKPDQRLLYGRDHSNSGAMAGAHGK